MNRNQKISLLKNIASGHIKISSLKETKLSIFVSPKGSHFRINDKPCNTERFMEEFDLSLKTGDTKINVNRI